jgi:Mor family transcriptional regulator
VVLYARDIARLRRIISLAEELIAEAPRATRGRPAKAPKSDTSRRRSRGRRVRRTGKELVEFRKTLRAERKKGTPVAEIARRYKVSTAYIYTVS